MELTQHNEGTTLVLGIAGKCSVEHAATLRDALLAAVATAPSLALDISGVEEADITFLQLLLSTAITLEQNGGALSRHGPVSQAALTAARVSGFTQTPQLTNFFSDEGRNG